MPTPPTRRQALASLTAATLAGCVTTSTARTDDDDATGANDDDSSESCEPTGPQTAGPYYPGEPTTRVDISEGITGVTLELDLQVVDSSCAVLAGAEVDLWCADKDGRYSGYEDFETEGESWQRGQQVTDAQGRVRFTCVFPGSYPGRAMHLHAKVRAEGHPELTTQTYFPDALAAAVLGTADYEGAEQTTNGDDNFYAGDTLMDVTGDVATGFSAVVVLTVDD
ncbi:MAG: protocatechuate dioxygenase [Deltaproteobacteria bacterium]|nr:protocatechuate dioxygenase [Deltaproteobacteria bacterium]